MFGKKRIKCTTTCYRTCSFTIKDKYVSITYGDMESASIMEKEGIASLTSELFFNSPKELKEFCKEVIRKMEEINGG